MATTSSGDVACTHCPAVERLLDEIADLENLVGLNNLPIDEELSEEFLVAYA